MPRRPYRRYSVPLLSRPADLVDVDDTNRPAGMDPYLAFARETPSGLVEYLDRAAIERGALAGQGLEIAWLAGKVDAFFIHVQGAARLDMTDGTLAAHHLCGQVRPALHRTRANSGKRRVKFRQNG